MYEVQPKKLLIMNILDILQKYTDENHRLSQKDIIDILEKEYEMKADRKSIKRNIMNLMDFGYEIEYSECVRKVPVRDKNGKDVYDPDTGKRVMEDSYIWSDYYLVRDFDDSELSDQIEKYHFDAWKETEKENDFTDFHILEVVRVAI